ncbi:HAMP domain-containing histidine kinase [Pseudohalocynthiibacter aestuariivivens]|uniref:histidine kinase n=1 Tax=Roseovarius pelagicus TaxID=2980108 RepID=A0ABY6D8S6_9RHOB|nr:MULTISPECIES: HAMP domain-containing sensor histidine kinase [Rhodobacterales]QIE45548.1 HAMP domain-containing histidine kinase [Pseudohalocynthiibacter aestuariivivens]UXX82531.1 HAMP domain-containing histidine kinase [Roseovarius pelagicus]
MSVKKFYQLSLRNNRNLFRLNAQMTDYARTGVALLPQRLAIYIAALSLVGFYYSSLVAIVCGGFLILSELFDLLTFRRILRMKKRDIADTRLNMRLLMIATAVSAANIAVFTAAIAHLQGPTSHFMPLFFLFAAGLFATMNNHQLKPILHLRLSFYFAVFFFIPLSDIISTSAPFSSELWAEFLTSIFVMFFLVDCSRISTGLYDKTLVQMEEIRQEHEKAKSAFVAKSDFLATVSHELRTPLTSIKGTLDLVDYGAYGEVPEKMKGALSIAQRNAGRLNALINDLLDLQKIEAGRMSFQFGTIGLADFLVQAVASNQPFASKFNVTFVLEDVPQHLFIYVDEARLHQVMSNILSNAAKFSNPGDAVTVTCQDRGDTVRISIIDRGIGLSESDRQIVFDEFSQLDSSDRRKVGGTGLGMNISKRIINAHSGVLDYFRNEGVGTTFYVDLPLVDADNESVSEEARVLFSNEHHEMQPE